MSHKEKDKRLPKGPTRKKEGRMIHTARQNIGDFHRRQEIAYIGHKYRERFHRNEIEQE